MSNQFIPSNDVNLSNNDGKENKQAPQQGNYSGTSPQYLESNWDSNLLMDPNHDILYNMDLGNANMNSSIAHNIQYQNDIHLAINMNDPSFIHPSHNQNQNQNQNQNPSIGPQLPLSFPASMKGPEDPSFKTSKSTVDIPTSTRPDVNVSPTSKPNSIGTFSSDPIPATKSKHRRPCDHCRRKKTKCVIIPGTNNCAQCETKSLTCTYVGSAAKRKPVDFGEDPEAKRGKPDNSAANNLSLLLNEIIPPNVPIRDVAPVQDYSVMNNSLLKKTLSLQFPRSSFYVGPTSYLYDINLLNLIIASQNTINNNNNNNGNSKNGKEKGQSNGKIEQVNLSSTISLRKVSDKAQFVLKDDQSPQSYKTMSNDVDTIEKFIAPHGQILIDLYFRIIHPSYPILHKKVFLEKYSRTHREFSAPLLAAVYVLAIQWWDYDPQLNRFPRPNVQLILKIGLNNYLLEILKRPKLSAVQAGLLLLQCKHIIRVSQTPNNNNNNQGSSVPSPPNAGINGKFNDSDYSDWVLCSQVIALSEELGLGLNCNNWKLPKWERGLRKRLAWAVYMEDKWLSLKNSRPSHISEINWAVVNLLEEDFPEKHGDGDLKEGSSDIDNGKKNFMCLINLSTILSDILNDFYSMKAMNEITDINQALALAKPLQLRLRNWYHSLPVELQMSSVQPRKLCSNGYLQLAYFATELTLHRKIITIIYQQMQNGENPSQQLINVCRAAARTRLLASIEFVRDLKPEHIHSFWHSSSSANFTLIGTFAAILFISSSTKEESDFYKDQIYNYRWILKISSKGFDQVGDALLKLDIVLNHIPGLLNDNVDLPMVVPNVPTINYLKVQKQQPPPLNSYSPQKSPYVSNSGRPSPVLYQNGRGSTSNTPLSNSTPNMNLPSSNNNANNANNNNNANANNNNNNSNNKGNPTRHSRMNSQPTANSPYDSPNFGTPPLNGQSQQTMSRGGQFVINSPQSSQGLSPKEFIKQQRPVISTQNSKQDDGSYYEPSPRKDLSNSRVNSPVLMRSPTTFSNTPVLRQDHSISEHDSHGGKDE